MNKEQTQKRILLASVIFFAFFIAYDFLYLQPKQALVDKANANNAVTLEKNKDPQIKNKDLNAAPSVKKEITTN
jgi:hypothetical protein